ncbi:MAG: phosphatidylglycerophosphatase A [Halocynthiibacter sp.]
MTQKIAHIIATFFGIGHLRPAPGTWGSAAAIPFIWLIHGLLGPWGLLIMTVFVFFIGWWATQVDTAGKDNHDPSEIVIDEVAGMCIALLPLSFGMAFASDNPWAFPYPGWVAGFLAFRLFDITKPWLVGWADRRNDAFGVMFDDVIAGLFAAISVSVLAYVAHVVLV